MEIARRIGGLLADDLNRNGVTRVLALEAENAALRAELQSRRAGVAWVDTDRPPQGRGARATLGPAHPRRSGPHIARARERRVRIRPVQLGLACVR